MITTRLKEAVAAAGITKDVTPHGFRHTAATLLLEGGADTRYVQQFLGHKDITTTARYTRVTIDHLRKVYRAAHPWSQSES